MIMNRYKCGLVAVSFVIFSCAACANGSGGIKSSSQGSVASQAMTVSSGQTNPMHIKKSLGTNLSIGADIDSRGVVDAVKILKAKAFTVNKDKLVDALIKPNKVIKTAQHGKGNSISFEYITADSTLEAGSEIFFETTFCKDYLPYLLCTDKTASWYSADQYSRTSNLPFATRASAVAAITKMLKSLGVNISQTYEGYSLDYKTMEKVQQLDKKDKDIAENIKGGAIMIKSHWSADDDLYYFIFHPRFGSLMIDQDNHGPEDASINGSYIELCYSKRGVELLRNSFLYTQIGEDRKDSKIIDSSAALQAVANKFKTMIVTDPIKITHIRLCYVAAYIDSSHINYNLIPAWRFDAEQSKTDKKGLNTTTVTSTFAIIINAITGKEI